MWLYSVDVIRVELALCWNIHGCKFYLYRPTLQFLMLFAYIEETRFYWYNASYISIYQCSYSNISITEYIPSVEASKWTLITKLRVLMQFVFMCTKACNWNKRREKNVLDLHGGSLVSLAHGEQKNKMYSYSKCNISVQALSQYQLLYPEWWNVWSIPNTAFSQEVILMLFSFWWGNLDWSRQSFCH